MNHTHTYALMELSSSAYAEIRARLVAAGYDHAIHDDDGAERLDMHGIAVSKQPTKETEVESTPDQPTQSTQPPAEHILQFFAYSHLPEPLRAVSSPFEDVAHRVIMTLPRSPERTVALRKLLESKDAAVRAALAK